MSEEANQIKKLRHLIPRVIGCAPGCSACCGPVPFSKWEWEHLRDKRIVPGHGGMCPYIENEKCAIYNERPIICRLFGTGSEARFLSCHKGTKVESDMRGYSPESVFAQYKKILFVTGVHGPFSELFAEIHLLALHREVSR